MFITRRTFHLTNLFLSVPQFLLGCCPTGSSSSPTNCSSWWWFGKCTLPRSPRFWFRSLYYFLRSNINKVPDLKILNTWARKGFGVQRHSARQLPSFKPHVSWKNASRYTVTILVGTQYYHIPSIRNGGAALAARATNELVTRATNELASEQHSQHCHYVAACWCTPWHVWSWPVFIWGIYLYNTSGMMIL